MKMRHKSSGVALVTAIFLLVVLAGLGVAVVALTTTERVASTQDELGARAYQAARAGLEWALYTDQQAGPLACPGTYTFAMPANTTLSSFTVTVGCTARSTGIGPTAGQGSTANRMTITSTACNGPSGTPCPVVSNSPDYVQRRVMAQL